MIPEGDDHRRFMAKQRLEQATGLLFSTDVSDSHRKMSMEWETKSSVSDSELSTDVSDTCRAKASRWEQRGHQE